MSTLTKVFVVLLVVFSIAFTAMTISVVARTTNWRGTALKYEEHARVADTNLRHMIAASSADLAAVHDNIRSLQSQIADAEKQVQARRREAAESRSHMAQLVAEKGSADAMNRGMLSQLQAAETARAGYQKQRDGLEERNIDLERRNIDLNDRVNQLTATVVVLNEQKRHFEQQINILQSVNEKLSRTARTPGAAVTMEDPRGAGLRGVRALTPIARAAIRGRVMQVSGDVVTISVGSADGVKKNMEFVIHRNGQYVGDLTIKTVDPDSSAGRLKRSTATPATGDQVTDANGLGGSRG